MTALLPRSRWRWSHREDHLLVRRKLRGDRAKAIARELHRSPVSVDKRFAALKRKLDRDGSATLRRHRREELELLDRMLAEATAAEVHGDERK